MSSSRVAPDCGVTVTMLVVGCTLLHWGDLLYLDPHAEPFVVLV